MKERPTDAHPLSDLAYDWITVIQKQSTLTTGTVASACDSATSRNTPVALPTP